MSSARTLLRQLTRSATSTSPSLALLRSSRSPIAAAAAASSSSYLPRFYSSESDAQKIKDQADKVEHTAEDVVAKVTELENQVKELKVSFVCC